MYEDRDCCPYWKHALSRSLHSFVRNALSALSIPSLRSLNPFGLHKLAHYFRSLLRGSVKIDVYVTNTVLSICPFVHIDQVESGI